MKKENFTSHLLLPIANPKSCQALTGLVNQLYADEDKTIGLVNFVKGHGSIKKSQEVLNLAKSKLSASFSINEVICHDSRPSHGIIKEAQREQVESIVMGWHGPDEKNRKKGRVLDPVLKKAPCNVIIAKDFYFNKDKLPRQILVPLSGIKTNDELALKTAERMINSRTGGRITILYFNESNIKLPLINHLMNEVITKKNIKLDVISSISIKPVKTTILQSREFDLLVMGISEPKLFKKGKPTYTERVAQELEGAMLIVRSPQLSIQKVGSSFKKII